MTEPLLRVEGVKTRFFTREGQVNAVEDVSFDIQESEVFGMVGESGSGKSVTALTIMDLVESPGRVTDGRILYRNPELVAEAREDHPEAVDGEYVDLRELPERTRRSLRGPTFSMIFQDPMSSFNPSLTIGEQIAEAVEVQRRSESNPRALRSRTQGYGLGRYVSHAILPSKEFVSDESRREAIELLERVGIPDPSDRIDEYPHQFSGGMLQRAMVAQAIAGEPDLLIADEPTTALDVTIQTQILELLQEIRSELGTSIMLITHNLGVIARVSDRVGVMYAGELVERGTLEDIFDDPVHPYTKGLIGSIPDFENPERELQPVEGYIPNLIDANMQDRCYFADRCPKAMTECLDKPPEYEVNETHGVKCVLARREYSEAEALPEDWFDAPESAGQAGDGDTLETPAVESTDE